MAQYLLPHETLLQAPRRPPAFRSDAEVTHRRTLPDAAKTLYVKPVPERQDIQCYIQNLSIRLYEMVPMRVRWGPEASTHQASTFTAYFRNVMISPVLRLFTLLRGRSTWHAVFSNTLSLKECDLIVFERPKMDFLVDDFRQPQASRHFPVVAVMSSSQIRALMQRRAASAPEMAKLVHFVWRTRPGSPIICCDLKHILILRPSEQWASKREIHYEEIPVNDLRTVRIVLAAYLVHPLAEMGYLMYRDPITYNEFWGVLPHPSRRGLYPDRLVFQSHQHRSDFDLPLIRMLRDHTDQFLRWARHMLENVNPKNVHDGEILTAATHGFSRINPVLRPYYPAATLPEATMKHVLQNRRASPLGDLAKTLMRSTSFSLRAVVELTAESLGPRLCRVYVCEILSVDGHSFPGRRPRLCLKLYDDRFFAAEELLTNTSKIFRNWHTAEDFVRREMGAYHKLNFAQGSLIPHFFGAHSFRLSNGLELYGILMEYIDAPCLSETVVQSLTEDERRQLIRSTRHAVRILQYSDVSQQDWHGGQILIVRARRGHKAPIHCVLVDFGACTQSTYPLEAHQKDDFGDCRDTLVYNGLPETLVSELFGRREVWDRCILPGGTEEEARYHQPHNPLLEAAGLPQFDLRKPYYRVRRPTE